MAAWSVPGISRWLSWESAFLESLGACWYMMSSGHRGSTDLLHLLDLALHLSFQNLEMGSLPASEALVTSLFSAGRQPGPGCSGVCCWCMVVYGHCLSTRGWAAVGFVSGVYCSDELVEHVVYSYRIHPRGIRPQAISSITTRLWSGSTDWLHVESPRMNQPQASMSYPQPTILSNSVTLGPQTSTALV